MTDKLNIKETDPKELDAESSKIDERIAAKQQQIRAMMESVRIYLQKKVDLETKQAVDNLQIRLEYQLKVLEEKGADAKIKAYKKLLNLLK